MHSLCHGCSCGGVCSLTVENSNRFDDAGGYGSNTIEWADVTRAQSDGGIVEAMDRTHTMIEFDLDGTIRWANDNFLSTTVIASRSSSASTTVPSCRRACAIRPTTRPTGKHRGEPLASGRNTRPSGLGQPFPSRGWDGRRSR